MFLGTYLHPSRHVLSIDQKAKIVIFRAIYLLTSCPLAVRNVKKSPGQETGLGNRGRLKVLNDTKLVSMSDLLIIFDQSGIIHNNQTSPIPQTSFLPWTFCHFLKQDSYSFLDNLGSIWYHSEPSDVPYSPNQFLALDFLQQDGSSFVSMH